MVETSWKGGKRDGRLYQKVRAERQRVLREKYERLACHITANWRGRPLSSLEVTVNLIAATTTVTGLSIHADVDLGAYKKGIGSPRTEMSALHLTPADFHGEWNYTITSRNPAAPSPVMEIRQK